MLGKDLYKVENCVDLSRDEVKSLTIFYRPLIGSHAFATYMYFLYSDETINFHELNQLLSLMNISVDKFEAIIKKLNEYRLVSTLKKENEEKYLFVLKKPLATSDFIKDELLSRDFIKKVGGPIFQELITSIKENGKHYGYKDISVKYTLDSLSSWSEEDETYVKKKEDNSSYKVDSFFDVNKFLSSVSLHLLPMKYRTYDNLKAIANLADLYNISYEKMKTFIPKVFKSEEDRFDLDTLKKLCFRSFCEYQTVPNNKYDIPCALFLMNLQNGKELTEYDRKIIYELSYDYYLKPEVINVLLQYCLKKNDNRLIEKYIVSLASDMHRNNIETFDKALERLDKKKTSQDNITTIHYDDSINKKVDLSGLEEFRK